MSDQRPILLRNLRPLPPLEGEAAPSTVDVSIDGQGRIDRVTPASAAPAAPVVDNARVYDLDGAYVSRGWIDLHTHVYYGATDISVRSVDAGLRTGVTTLVDAGSSGEANFAGFREYVAESAAESIYAFLNIGSIGLTACNRISELRGPEDIDVDRVLERVRANREVIRGIKVRASGVIVGGWGMSPVRIAKKVARILELPMMVHIGEVPPTLDEVLSALDPGDVVTHCFNGKPGGNILDDSKVLEAARAALSEGILFDVGHGAASFSFDVGKRALDLGILPNSISTDLHQQNINGPVWDLPTTMSKMIALGMGLEAVIDCVTAHPAAVLRIDAGGWLSPGTLADLTVFTVDDADEVVEDSRGGTLRLERTVRPRYAVRGTEVTASARRRDRGA